MPKAFFIKKNQVKKSLGLIFLLIIISCSANYTPKPRGFFRIELPEHQYTDSKVQELPYQFQQPEGTLLHADEDPRAEANWYNLDFPYFKATLHLSYKNLKNSQLNAILEDTRFLVYKHTVKASTIEESIIKRPADKVYGIVYRIGGEAASAYQFFLTDSTRHFLRGALYIDAMPQQDSLQPVIDYLSKDIDHIVSTLKWKNK